MPGEREPEQLDGLVLDYMRKHATDESLGPTAIADAPRVRWPTA